MKEVIRQFVFPSILIIGLSSCAKTSPPNSAGEALQRLANAVTTLALSTSPPSNNTSQKGGLPVEKPAYAPTNDTNVAELHFENAGSVNDSRIEYFELDGVTPTPSNLTYRLDGYIAKETNKSTTKKYTSTFEDTVTFKKVPDRSRLPFDMERIGTGTIDYYNDDFVLTGDKILMKLNGDGLYLRYEMSFFDHQYFFTLERRATLDEIKAAASDPSIEPQPVSSDITDLSGNVIGKFVLYPDSSVKIFDNNGEVVKAAGIN